ncbi:MAG: hypothetical protein M0C28_24060 [Candidatus Moduliflexus flocculans]|nr:hypothetical protein [Candidatus Moduliflexus flocculans]
MTRTRLGPSLPPVRRRRRCCTRTACGPAAARAELPRGSRCPRPDRRGRRTSARNISS